MSPATRSPDANVPMTPACANHEITPLPAATTLRAETKLQSATGRVSNDAMTMPAADRRPPANIDVTSAFERTATMKAPPAIGTANATRAMDTTMN